ncbi:glucose-1-phosphate adenylyltransferase family protein [Chloroflexota bacterium]
MERVLAVVLAGGSGERLSILAQERAKPAVPFAGKYRIIDFTLSNCANSGIRHVLVLTQYRPLSLAEHIGIGIPWGFVPPEKNIRMIQPYLGREQGKDWYQGTADAVYQNLDQIEELDVDLVMVLSGDHVYKMDYQPMVEFHRQQQADVTLAVMPFPEEALSQFGTVITDESGQIVRFREKVKNPRSNLVSMGVYLFNKEVLFDWLGMDGWHDFGRNIFPKMVKKARMFAYPFNGYWRDVGTVQSYWQANMDILEIVSPFLGDKKWPVRTVEEEKPPSFFGEASNVTNSLICDGCIIEGQVEHSVLSPGVRIASGAVVRDSIILHDAVIGKNSVVDYCILDKRAVVEAECHIGFGDDYQVNRREPKAMNTGITIVGKRAKVAAAVKIGRNCLIHPSVVKGSFLDPEVPSGETIKPVTRRRR